ncbi:MAG: fibronectin type III domain-containing protein, partial [Eubacterium sp.]
SSSYLAGRNGRRPACRIRYTIALSQSYIDSSKASKSSSSSNKLTAKSTSSSITLSWSKQDGVKKYTVEKYNSKKKKWQKVKTVNTNKITIKKLNSATSYKFRIKAKNYSKTITAATCPSKVPYIGAKFIYQGEKEINAVTWDKVKGASGYEIEFKNTDNGTKKKVTVKGNKKTLYKTPAKWTHARIRAYKSVGNKKYYGTYTSYKEIRG